MPSKRLSEILTCVVVAVLASGVTCSVMFIIVQVQLGEMTARHEQEIRDLKTAVTEAKEACSTKKHNAHQNGHPHVGSAAPHDGERRSPHHIRHRPKRAHGGGCTCAELSRKVSRTLYNLKKRINLTTAHVQLVAETPQKDDDHDDGSDINHTVIWQDDTAEFSDSSADPTFSICKDRNCDPLNSDDPFTITMIKVRKSGFFFIYAQVKFQGRGMSRPQDHYQTYYIMRNRASVTNDEILAEQTITPATIDPGNLGNVHATDTSYTGKAVRLTYGDMVYLQIRRTQALSQVKFDRNTYIGMIYLGKQD